MRYILLVVIILTLLLPTFLLASDYSAAQYVSSIQVSNNSSGNITNGVAVFTLSTADMISGQMLNATATDATIVYGGSDIAFMPSVNSTNPWCLFVSSLSGNSAIYPSLYSKGATGGKLAHFPGSVNSIVGDNADLEPSENFSISITAFIDTSVTGVYFLKHYDAALGGIQGSMDGATGNVCFELSPNGGAILAKPSIAITTGWHNILVSLAGNVVSLSIDGGAPVTKAMVLPVGNSNTDWLFYPSYIMPCVLSTNITVGGVLQGSWAWQYGTTFTDLSGHGHNFTPTFRTTGTTNLNGTVISQTGTTQGSTPSANVTGGWTMETSTPATPDLLFAEGGYNFPLGSYVRQAAIDMGQDPTSALFLWAFGWAIAVAFMVFLATHKVKIGQRGSLALASLAAGSVLVYFYRTGTVPGMVIVPFAIIAILLLVWRRTPSFD